MLYRCWSEITEVNPNHNVLYLTFDLPFHESSQRNGVKFQWWLPHKQLKGFQINWKWPLLEITPVLNPLISNLSSLNPYYQVNVSYFLYLSPKKKWSSCVQLDIIVIKRRQYGVISCVWIYLYHNKWCDTLCGGEGLPLRRATFRV